MQRRHTVKNDHGTFTFEYGDDGIVTEVRHGERMFECEHCKKERSTHRTCEKKTAEYKGTDVDGALLAEKFTSSK